MASATNFRWGQGEDLTIELIYKEGEDPKTAVAVPLGAGYDLRMDIVNPSNGLLITSLTSEDDEVILSSGEDDTPNITVYLPRALTLSGGEIYTVMLPPTNLSSFSYDIFLRNTQSDRQIKILKGTITVEDSHTLWP